MSQLKAPQAFVRRFDAVRSRLLQVQLVRGAIRALVLLIAGVALLALVDYLWEVSRLIRETGLTALLAVVVVLAVSWFLAAFRQSNRPRTALDIEEQFPELGQSVRTAVQFGGRTDDAIRSDGVRSTLVDALEEQVDLETEPLPIEAIVPTGRLKFALATAVALVAVLGILYVSNSEWKTATHRALLDERPYTKLAVTPGTAQIEIGHDLTIGVEVQGRTPRQLTLFTRAPGDPAGDWQEREITAEDLASSDAGLARYEVPLTKVKEALVYRVVAGKLHSDDYNVTVKYPLALEKIEVALTPPAYTGQETTTVTDGNIQALEGTSAVFKFELDRAPAKAHLVLANPRERRPADGEDEQPPQELPLKIDGAVLSMAADLLEDKVYSIVAVSSDGMKLPDNSYRIRVRKDQPPQVWFDEPREALEVHTLAEVLMRIRARDDFGLLKAGIVFQVNNEEEHTLLQKDFEAALAEAQRAEADAAEGKETPATEVAATGTSGTTPPAAAKRPAPTTQTVLDKLLPLEHFELSQQDSVTYYAFAEDNFPAGTHRTESDLRFVDIRPFKRTYKLIDPEDRNPMGMGKPLPELDELIARQRFALNRTLQLARAAARAAATGGAAVSLGTVDSLIEYQQKIATATRELAEALRAREVAGNDLLFQAEESMLAAIDSLSAGKYDNAVLQEKDALRYLIEGRTVLQIAILKKSPKTQAELRAFQRMQMQKLRKPKNDDEAEEVAAKLRELADQEELVYETLGGVKIEGEESAAGKGGGSGKPKETDKPADPKETSDKPDAADDKPSKPADGSAGEQPAGEKGEKGEQAKPGAEQKGKGGGEKGEGSGGQGEKPEGSEKGSGPTREELIQKQADIVAEAAEIQKVMDKMKGLSDLAKSRIADALKTAEGASGSLEKGDSKAAMESAGKATGMFRELARNVEALAAAETSQRIAMARDISEEIAKSERDLASELERQGNGGNEPQKDAAGSGSKPQSGKPQTGKSESGKAQSGKGDKPQRDAEKSAGSGKGDKPADEPKPGGSGGKAEENAEGQGGGSGKIDRLAARSDRIAEAGKTLEDVLKAIARSNEPGDREAIGKVQELLQQGKLDEAIKRLEGQGSALRKGPSREASADARDVADRFEATAQKLEGLHRSIVAPRIAELMKIESEAVNLQEKLERLETQGQITDWHRGADELLEDLNKLGVAEEARDELEGAMEEAGWNTDRRIGGWDWTVHNGWYGAPVRYHRSVKTIVADLHAVIQELILGDLGDSADEHTPPEYERLVERYYQVLSSDK